VTSVEEKKKTEDEVQKTAEKTGFRGSLFGTTLT
jgi:hypothetical protein